MKPQRYLSNAKMADMSLGHTDTERSIVTGAY